MNANVLTAAEEFVRRATAKARAGSTAAPSELAALNEEMGGRIPPWLVELLTSVPLCGLVLEVETPEGDYSAGWNDIAGIRSESLECYPGLTILPAGYINVASDDSGGGNPFFIAADEGDDPPVYQVYHEVGEAEEEIIAAGRVTVAASLSSLFVTAQPY